MDKKKHFTAMLAAGAAALLFATVPTACTDEREGTPCGEERIGFAVDLWKEGTEARATQTRAIETPADTLPEASVIPLEGDGLPEGEPLYLHAVTTEGIETENGGRESRTRAARVDNTTMHEEMAVTAFVYPAADSWPAAYTGGTPSAETYMRAVRVKKSEAWNTSYYWPGAARRISFFAAAPHGSAGLTALNDGAAGNPPYLSYTVPAGVDGQKDLLVASATDRPGNTNAAEPLAMKHALTAVRFVTGNDMLPGKVSKITLKSVYGTGKLPLTAAPAWYDLAGTTDFAQTFSPEATAPAPPVPDTPLTPEEGIFMMLPQTLPTGAQIEVTYTDNLTNTLRTLTASIAGSTWPMGKTVTYRISTSSIVVTSTLTVTAPANEYLYTGGTQNYTVTSYATITEGGTSRTVPAAWEAEFSEDGGTSWSSTKPAWLTAFTKEDNGGTSATSYTATVGAQTGVVSNPQNAALQAATPVNDGTNTNIYDLSTKGGTAAMRTANCYIVNTAGRYKLPLAYGNAVDYVKVPGTGKNTSAYTSTATGTNVLKPFINHLGNGITDPYIYNNANCTPNNCTLVWQDEQNLVTNVSLSADSRFLEFTVNQATIKQGNAVVAVRNASNTVLWSWHIWVTDYVPGSGDKAITNFQSKTYTIMPVNLGWCDGSSTTYAERTVQVRFKQTGTAAQQTITVKQKGHAIAEFGNSTYYQWGRKDPFVGGIPDGSTTYRNKTWYDASGAVQTNQNPPTSSFAAGNACITSGITLPNTFCTYMYMDEKYANLWSANYNVYTANDNEVVKTIYDPCPVGYKMPPGNAFTGFTTTGQNTSNSSQFNVSGTWNNGWNFHCGLNHTGDTVFFPAIGERIYYSAVPRFVGNCISYWSAAPNSRVSGWRLYFYSGRMDPLYYNDRSNGFGVRPCQE